MTTKIYDNQIKDSILLTGTPTASTPSVSDDSTRIATTEFVHNVFGEFYPTGLTPTYVDATHFTVSGDLTAIFTKGRVLKITDTGGTFNAVCSASAYNAGTELTTVTVAGDTLDSGLSAVLYAVQQVTGAIWESGSNANGEYVRYADGRQECSKSVTWAGTETYRPTTTLPIAMVSATYMCVFIIPSSETTFLTFSIERQTSSTVYYWVQEVASTGTVSKRTAPVPVKILVIGRWF